MNASIFIRSLALFSFALWLVPASGLLAQNRPFQMAGMGIAPEGLSVQDIKPHFSQGGGNVLGAHRGAGSFQIVEGPIPTVDAQGNLVALTAKFTSGPEGFNFVSRNGTLATDYGIGPAGNEHAPGTVVLRVLRVEGAVAVVKAHFLANFEIDPAESTGQFAGCSGRWLMDARSAGSFRLNLITQTSEPFRYAWRAVPGTGSLQCP